MDKKSKDALRRYKKSRQQSSSDSSSSSDSDSASSSSYSSSSSGRKAAERHRKKKARQAVAAASSRRSSSSSGDERRKREKREHACQKKLEAKRNHLKRKLKEAKLKKRAAAAAAAAISGHSHRSLSPATQAKLKKLAERKHQRTVSKEHREREREKHRAARGERTERDQVRGSRSPTKITKIRIHQDVKPRQKSPTRVHQQLMSREKIIIQTRTRDRTPSVERQRREHKARHADHDGLRDRERRDRERAEREAARDKERAEALARCQERQRERERLAREKLRREEDDKKYASSGLISERERLLPRPAERELAIANARGYNSRERSLEAVDRIPRRTSQRELELYEREREFLEAERRGLLDREELRREREYLAARRRELSPISEHYASRLRDERDLYEEEERERAYSRAYLEEGHHARDRDGWLDPREMRDRELRDIRDARELRELEQLRELYPDERERIIRERERERSLSVRGDWKEDWPPAVERKRGDWDDASTANAGFVGGPVRGLTPAAKVPREKRAASEPDWDADETTAVQSTSRESTGSRGAWDDREIVTPREKHSTSRPEHGERRWPANEWRDNAAEGGPSAGRGTDGIVASHHLHRESRVPRGFRRGGHQDHGERNPGGSSFRSHAPPSLMTLPVQAPGSTYHGGPPGAPRFPNKRNMTYTNPNLIKKQQAALAAAKAAAQANAVAAATTAVAAAKAAAQSAANATTNPGILGQIGGQSSRQQEAHAAAVVSTAEKPEAGEIVGDTDSHTTSEPEITAQPTAEVQAKESTAAQAKQSSIVASSKASGELSEISDSDDDILDKEPAKAPTPPAARSEAIKIQESTVAPVEEATTPHENEKQEEEDLLDFEEISDGELEEDARNKGVGDALGVDWASLIAETKRQAASANPQDGEETTTAKQKWQPHRILLDVGISMQMAGEDYAKKLLQDAKQKLEDELCHLKAKGEVKEGVSATNEGSQAKEINLDNNKKCQDKKSLAGLDETSCTLDVDRMHPIACIQVAERIRRLDRRSLISNACGAHSRALSARQDLKLRRQLCGLPARECDLPRPLIGTSNAMKAKALAAFQRTFEVKSF